MGGASPRSIAPPETGSQRQWPLIILVHDLAGASRTPSIQHLGAMVPSLGTTPGDATFMAVAGQFRAAGR
ncbi:MAG TPA: hypothetical protein VFV05_00670 [Methylomirabilota bacterium]|nr:hypothetical protein [Methylomirabilota bacterium]